MLRDMILDPAFDVEVLARKAEGLSGSDLKELCRNAASIPVREEMRKLQGKTHVEIENLKQTVNNRFQRKFKQS